MYDLERVRKVARWLIFEGLAENDTDLAKKLGYTKSSISQILNGKIPISTKFIEMLCMMDERINKVWISGGSGSMLIDERKSATKFNFDNSLFANESSSINTGSQVFSSEMCNECKKKDTIIFDLQQEISNLKSQIIDLLIKK